MKGKTAVGCSSYRDCGFKLPFVLFGKKLSEKQIHDIILKGKSSKLKGFTNHPDHLTEGVIRISDQGEAELAAE